MAFESIDSNVDGLKAWEALYGVKRPVSMVPGTTLDGRPLRTQGICCKSAVGHCPNACREEASKSRRQSCCIFLADCDCFCHLQEYEQRRAEAYPTQPSSADQTRRSEL